MTYTLALRRAFRVRRTSVNCTIPEDMNTMFAELNTHLNTSMFLQVNSALTRYLPNELNTNLVFDRMHRYGGRTCPDVVTEDVNAPLSERSLCPWYYEADEMPAGHYPSVIPQATCKCTNCVQHSRSGCERVSTTVRVLKETGCMAGFQTYTAELRVHHVGIKYAGNNLHHHLIVIIVIIDSSSSTIISTFFKIQPP
ncbi:interleukin 17-like protein [Haliotis asinina]|uniref:interleukin 17-like protein n=1 Tax=Haliotis asinina TaxID=109174 RepID=UPI0035322C48